MRILHTVEFYHPSVGGMQEVVKQLSERLVKLGHEVTVATSRIQGRETKNINGVKIMEFSISGNTVRGLTGEVEHYRKFLLESDFDVITNFAAQQWATDVMLPMLDEIKCAKVFVPTGFSGLYLPEYRKYFEDMKRYMAQYQMNIYLSDDYRDINFARENGIKRNILIPNGAGEDEFSASRDTDIRSKLGIPRKHVLILHVGSHTGTKGHVEAVDIFERSNLNNATLLIVGNYFPDSSRIPGEHWKWRLRRLKNRLMLDIRELKFELCGAAQCPMFCGRMAARFNSKSERKRDGKRLIVSSLGRADTVAAYHDADLFIFPSRIECSPLVLFECMASKTPFLTTDVGNASEIVKWSGSGIVLSTRKDVNGYSIVDADAAIGVLEEIVANTVKRRTMAESGYSAWQERFSWEKIALRYESLYKRLVLADGFFSSYGDS